jgi:hypothetical protein
MRKLWKRFVGWWMPIAEVIGNFMNRLILSIFYFVIVLPFGVGVRLFSDPLELRPRRETVWVKFSDRSQTTEDGRRQF